MCHDLIFNYFDNHYFFFDIFVKNRNYNRETVIAINDFINIFLILNIYEEGNMISS